MTKGFLEHCCVMALEREITARGHQIQREVSIPVMYKGELFGRQRLDMIVGKRLVVEVKAGPLLRERDSRQVYNYLRVRD